MGSHNLLYLHKFNIPLYGQSELAVFCILGSSLSAEVGGSTAGGSANAIPNGLWDRFSVGGTHSSSGVSGDAAGLFYNPVKYFTGICVLNQDLPEIYFYLK